MCTYNCIAFVQVENIIIVSYKIFIRIIVNIQQVDGKMHYYLLNNIKDFNAVIFFFIQLNLNKSLFLTEFDKKKKKNGVLKFVVFLNRVKLNIAINYSQSTVRNYNE